MTEVVLAGACRTAIGKFGGSLAGVPAVELGAIVIREALARAGVRAPDVDEVLMGCVLTAGLGQNPARQAAMSAGVPAEVPAMTLNNVCGSGLKAQAAGVFADEIVPVAIRVKKETVEFRVDENPRAGTTVEGLARLRPAFQPEGGTVTAGNASGINDGAAAIVVMSAAKAAELGVRPLARLVAGASAGVDPAVMGLGPVNSTRKALAKAGLSVDDIDLIEANEAFAAQCAAVGAELGFPAERTNVSGGAIALGHPIGASGCRILVTLLHGMARLGAQRGLATLCVGGGMGVTTIVEGV